MFAQSSASPTGILRGQVADPTGAVIPNATVTVTPASGHAITTTSNSAGGYAVRGLKPGKYTVSATAEGFAPSVVQTVVLNAGQTHYLDLALSIAVEQQQVVVNEENPTVSVSPESNANSLTITGKDLDALSDDPDELQNELNALAGPAAGPNGGQIYIDGFTAGQLPPKSAIREIRITQNPFSTEYDKLGYGRIEIFTKPGTDKLHGQFFLQGNASQLNTGNPFDKNIPDYHSYQFNGTVNGPISKNASFFVSAERRNIQDDAVVSAYPLLGEVNGDFASGNYSNAADYNTQYFSDALVTPMVRTNIAPRVDIQLGAKNTLTLRYQYFGNSEDNQGVGQFSLRSQAYNSSESESTVQLSDTEVISDKIVNETRFQYLRDRSNQTPSNTTAQVQVSGAETYGGQSEQFIQDHQDRFEFWNLTYISPRNHSITVGTRLRDARDANAADSSFNGIFTFGGHRCLTGAANCVATSPTQAYALTLQGQHNGQTFQQIRANGGGACQFSYVTGVPNVEINRFDAALFYQDDWRVRPNITFSYGLRWESQNYISDHSDWAPRFSLAWGLNSKNKSPKTVLRAGFGFFYDRFQVANILQAERENGIRQQQYVVENPTCFFTGNAATSSDVIPTCSEVGSSSSKPAQYQINPSLHAPTTMQSAISIEQQISKGATFSVTYLNSHGTHQLDTINANAPYMPGYNPAAGDVFQYYSEGLFNQNQIITNFNARFSPQLSIFGFYTLSFANGDVNGVSSNPSNSANLKQDYGRAGFDVRNRMFLIGTWAAPHGLRFSPFVVYQSGRPFNITVGEDLNGDSFFTDRPSYAQSGDTDTISTAYGNFNLDPSAGEKPIPINAGNGPNLFTFNLRASKTYAFGPETKGGGGGGGGFGGGGRRDGGLGGRGLSGGGGPHGAFGDQTNRKFNLTLSAQALNLFNDINLAPPSGVLDTQLFGKSNALAGQIFSSGSASRRVFLQAVFTF